MSIYELTPAQRKLIYPLSEMRAGENRSALGRSSKVDVLGSDSNTIIVARITDTSVRKLRQANLDDIGNLRTKDVARRVQTGERAVSINPNRFGRLSLPGLFFDEAMHRFD